MILSNACPLYRRHESGAARHPGGVWLLADVLPELLARYQVSDDEEGDSGKEKGESANLCEQLLSVG